MLFKVIFAALLALAGLSTSQAATFLSTAHYMNPNCTGAVDVIYVAPEATTVTNCSLVQTPLGKCLPEVNGSVIVSCTSSLAPVFPTGTSGTWITGTIYGSATKQNCSAANALRVYAFPASTCTALSHETAQGFGSIKADCNSLNIYSDLTCTTVAGTLPLDGICYPVSNSTMGGGPLDFAFSATCTNASGTTTTTSGPATATSTPVPTSTSKPSSADQKFVSEGVVAGLAIFAGLLL